MQADFDEFTEMVERCCTHSWRSIVGKDSLPNDVESVLFTFRQSDKDGDWCYSFALRCSGKWYQAIERIKPVEYDMFEPSSETNQMPNRVASDICMKMVSSVAEQLSQRSKYGN